MNPYRSPSKPEEYKVKKWCNFYSRLFVKIKKFLTEESENHSFKDFYFTDEELGLIPPPPSSIPE